MNKSDTYRTQLYSDFNFSAMVSILYDHESKKSELQDEIDRIESEIAKCKSDLPPEIISLYEQMRVVDKLKGPDHV